MNRECKNYLELAEYLNSAVLTNLLKRSIPHKPKLFINMCNCTLRYIYIPTNNLFSSTRSLSQVHRCNFP